MKKVITNICDDELAESFKLFNLKKNIQQITEWNQHRLKWKMKELNS